MDLCSKTLSVLLLVVALTGCIATSDVKVESDPEFTWDAMKRHRILVTPLLDLRTPSADYATKNLAFPDEKARIAYAERFKQKFFSLRNDIRVYGAGGAFEHVSRLKNLNELARKVVDGTPLPAADVEAIKEGSQSIRYLFFYAITRESLEYDLRYRFREDQEYDDLTYISRRKFTLTMAMWDAEKNQTVWTGSQILRPASSNHRKVSNPGKVKETKVSKKGQKTVYWSGTKLFFSLETERERHPDFFPAFPDRDGSIEGSFDDFTLSLPINPEEVDNLEYSHFVYHLPLAGLAYSTIGSAGQLSGELETSAIINYRFRLGGKLFAPLTENSIKFSGEDHAISEVGFGATFDFEWRPTKKIRLITGLLGGFSVFDIKTKDELARQSSDDDEPSGKSDGTALLWPRVRLVMGNLDGFQWGAGYTYRYRYGIEEEILRKNLPSDWSAEIFLGAAIRGF